ncbi:MAG: 50S ribosome-binding GTPase, partial [Acidobacteria bacterium]|nr:50S ribosome-binding GTPase [Acidobacteriota bacterium]
PNDDNCPWLVCAFSYHWKANLASHPLSRHSRSIHAAGFNGQRRRRAVAQRSDRRAAQSHPLFPQHDRRPRRLRLDLEKIERTRKIQRAGRHGTFTVALVGYTNAGKSTLFNRLTGDDTYAANKLFATLDSRLRKAGFETPRETVIIDTVGFVRKLPHHLVASFRSTMEEAVSADLVLHIVDFSHPQYDDQEAVGNEVLADLGIEPARSITVYNKIDRIEHEPHRDEAGVKVWVSALNGDGIELLETMIRGREKQGGVTLDLLIPPDESKALSQLYELGAVHQCEENGDGLVVTAWVPDESSHLFDRFVRNPS